MNRHIGQISLLVHDYDDAIAFYTQKLSFALLEDTRLSDTKRWVRIAPHPDAAFCLLLARADSDDQRSRVGNQTGGRVFLFLYTDDFWRDYDAMREAGIPFTRGPVEEPYGTVAVFADLYGNLWDMIQPIS